MTKANTQVIAKIAAMAAGLTLVVTAFALSASSAHAAFDRDLTIGSTGADVTALQNWLIGKGFTIPAGATGYFGAQTQAALAKYQASVSISPAAGYFGPITRAKLTSENTPAPSDDDEDEDDDEDDEDENDDEDEDDEEADEDDEDEDNVETSARVTQSDNANDDYATFEITIDFEAIGEDSYISQNAGTAFTYQIENASTGAVVSSATSETAIISSDADTEGNSFRIEEGESEEFTFTVTFDPLPGDEGASYRMQLLTVVSGDDEGDNNTTWTARPASKYETRGVYIND